MDLMLPPICPFSIHDPMIILALVLGAFSFILGITSFIVSWYMYRDTSTKTMIASFISVTNSFFTLDTRQRRRCIREDKMFTESAKKKRQIDDITESVKKKRQIEETLAKLSPLDKKQKFDMSEIVSAYNRLGFVLDNFDKIKDKFLEWDPETVVDTWDRVKLYIYQARKDNRNELGLTFQWLAEQAEESIKSKNKQYPLIKSLKRKKKLKKFMNDYRNYRNSQGLYW